jgi:hypothetical protein
MSRFWFGLVLDFPSFEHAGQRHQQGEDQLTQGKCGTCQKDGSDPDLESLFGFGKLIRFVSRIWFGLAWFGLVL